LRAWCSRAQRVGPFLANGVDSPAGWVERAQTPAPRGNPASDETATTSQIGCHLLLAELLVSMLQHVFDQPPDHLAVPWRFLAALGGAATRAAARRASWLFFRSGGCRSTRS